MLLLACCAALAGGCASDGSGGSSVHGSVYYGVGWNDPYYYGGGWDNDVVECDMVKTIVRGHAACHVSGVVMPLKKALVIEIKCLVSGVGGNLRWEGYAERSPGFTILLMRLNLFDFNARLSQ